MRLAVTGVLEHNAVGAVARLLQACCSSQGKAPQGDPPMPSSMPCACVNFGCVGAYEGRGLSIGDTFFVREARHFDVDVPGVASHSWDIRSFRLPVPEGEKLDRIVNATGSRFSQGQPGCDCEDMELYGVASLCSHLRMPLYSVKYVANFCNESGHSDFVKNVHRVRVAGEEKVLGLLRRLAEALAEPDPDGGPRYLALPPCSTAIEAKP